MYRQAYGSPEVDQTVPMATLATVSDDGLSVLVQVDNRVQGHVHDFHLPKMRSVKKEKLVHTSAYYTLNEIPMAPSTTSLPNQTSETTHPQTSPSQEASDHPVQENDAWLTFKGKPGGPGNGKHVVLIAAEQEYRSEQSMPMLAKAVSYTHLTLPTICSV